MTVERIVLYGDFNCPWSYLASRRAALLITDGVKVDWRAVAHEARRPNRVADSSARFTHLREEIDQVLAELLPGEELAYSLAGFVPHTQAAVSGYAEAYAAGVSTRVRHLLFEAFWIHALDLNDAKIVRTLMVDAVRSGSSPSELLREWGYAVDVTGGPLTTTAWRLVSAWAAQWRATSRPTVPVLLVDDTRPLFGTDAVKWLGAELMSRGLESRPAPTFELEDKNAHRDIASLSWVSQHGGRWMRDYQHAHPQPALPSAG